MGANPTRSANHYAENTLSSFRAAIECGVYGIEFDAWTVFEKGDKEGSPRVIVMHDEWVNRTTNGQGSVRELDYARIRRLDAGKGQIVPTLEEVLDLADRRAVCNVEMKGTGIAGPVAGIMQRYISEKGWKHDDFLVSSFSMTELRELRKLMPEARLGLLINEDAGWLENCKEIEAYSVNPEKKIVSAAFLKKAHDNDLKAFVWTVNSFGGIKRIKDMEVDGFFTDFPEEAISRIS